MKDLNQQLNDSKVELKQQQVTIDQQDQILLSIYNNVQEAIFVVNVTAEGKFIYQGFNPAAHRLTGIETVVDKTPAELLPADVAKVVEGRYRQCVESKTTISYEECLPFQNQDTWWLTNLNPIADESGEVYRIIGTSVNINERRQAEAELESEKVFLKALLDNLSDGVVSCDADGNLALFNQASQKFFLIPQQPLPPEKWAEYYNLYDAEGKAFLKQEEIPLFRAFSGESFVDSELIVVDKDGEFLTFSVNGSPIIDSNGHKLGAVVAIRDITQGKQAELEIARLNAELESKVQKRTVQLEQANKLLLGATEQLRKSNQELEQFAYVASHDLKAPLRAIANLSLWIEEDLLDKLDDDTRYNMNLLRGRVHRLENLINGLLAYSRVGRLESEPQEIKVDLLLADIIDSLDIPPHFQVEIQGQMPTLVTEFVPLQQVFNNLIVNAVKHSDCEQGRITISVKENDDHYEFAVADNGKGIDPQYHQRIFTIFQTLDARDIKENTGIGLSIVQKAVESQNGKVKVKSQLGAGTTFSFTWKK